MSPPKAPHIFFSVGNAFYDYCAIALLKEIRSCFQDARFSGIGGTIFSQDDLKWHDDIAFSDRQLYGKILQNFQKNGIDAVILIDEPENNLPVAKAARKCGIPVFYVLPSKLWCWAPRKLRGSLKYIDYVFTYTDFESTWFYRHGCRPIEISYPFLDYVKNLSACFDRNYLGKLSFLPHEILLVVPSRQAEKTVLDELVAIAQGISCGTRIKTVLGASDEEHAGELKARFSMHENVTIVSKHVMELTRAAKFVISDQEHLSMELVASQVPSLIYKKVTRGVRLLSRFLFRSRFLSPANLFSLDVFSSVYPFYRRNRLFYPDFASFCDSGDCTIPEFWGSDDMTQEAVALGKSILESRSLYESYRERMQKLSASLTSHGNPFPVMAKSVLGTLGFLQSSQQEAEPVSGSIPAPKAKVPEFSSTRVRT